MKLPAIWLGKLAILGTRLFKAGSGTTLPGLLAEFVDIRIIPKLTQKLPNGAIVITGTNGKTTTAKMLTEILTESGFRVLNNPSGSNLTRGVASALISSVNIFGTRFKADIAVFEVDEATMPEATVKIRPKMVLVTNLFRDQLDRYGELDKTATIIGGSIRGFSDLITVLNADDPLVSDLSKYAEGPVVYFGINEPGISTTSKAAMDSKDCLECGNELEYKHRYFGHLGVWSCPKCGFQRVEPKYSASQIGLEPKKSSFKLTTPKEETSVEMSLTGLYNIYNALAAAAVADLAGSGGAAISHALRNFSAAFGRMELLKVAGREIMLLLAKNPTGANQSLASIYADKKPKNVLFALNDNFADGTDVSWIWDIDFEAFDLNGSLFIASGIRAEDMALRFKYAGVPEKNILVEKDLKKAVLLLSEKTPSGTAYIIPTYTAMMEIRSAFVEQSDALASLGKATRKGL